MTKQQIIIQLQKLVNQVLLIIDGTNDKKIINELNDLFASINILIDKLEK